MEDYEINDVRNRRHSVLNSWQLAPKPQILFDQLDPKQFNPRLSVTSYIPNHFINLQEIPCSRMLD